jgi:hypothetical protein
MQITGIYWMILGILIMIRTMIARVMLIIEEMNNLKHYYSQ